MQSLQVFNVIPKLPTELEPLWKLARNYWFAWNFEAEHFFAQIDPALWEESYHNPVWFINHLPQSTLLMLVSALAGRELILEAYRQAVEQRYRFFSYGDCMLIL